MRASALRALRSFASSARASASDVPSARLAWRRDPRLPFARSPLRGTSRGASAHSARSSAPDGGDAPPINADAAHERALAAAAAVERTLSGGDPGKAFEETEVDRAKAQILRFLNYKPRTKSELRVKLVEDKLYDPDVANAAIAHLESVGVVSDVDYAEQWARYKWRAAKWAPWRIRTSLREKGVSGRDAAEGVERVFDTLGDVEVDVGRASERRGEEEAPEETGEVAIAGEETDKGAELVRAARKRWALSAGMPRDTRRRRLSAWLERRGHRTGTARSIIETLEAEDERLEWELEAEEAERERNGEGDGAPG